jgi:hypothetical protein
VSANSHRTTERGKYLETIRGDRSFVCACATLGERKPCANSPPLVLKLSRDEEKKDLWRINKQSRAQKDWNAGSGEKIEVNCFTEASHCVDADDVRMAALGRPESQDPRFHHGQQATPRHNYTPATIHSLD